MPTSDEREKAMKAIAAYLEHKGFEILEQDYLLGGEGGVDFIAREGGDLVFVATAIIEEPNSGSSEEKSIIDRAMFERVAAAYLAKSDVSGDCAIRFDFVSMLVLSDSRAFLRHHRSCA